MPRAVGCDALALLSAMHRLRCCRAKPPDKPDKHRCEDVRCFRAITCASEMCRVRHPTVDWHKAGVHGTRVDSGPTHSEAGYRRALNVRGQCSSTGALVANSPAFVSRERSISLYRPRALATLKEVACTSTTAGIWRGSASSRCRPDYTWMARCESDGLPTMVALLRHKRLGEPSCLWLGKQPESQRALNIFFSPRPDRPVGHEAATKRTRAMLATAPSAVVRANAETRRTTVSPYASCTAT